MPSWKWIRRGAIAGVLIALTAPHAIAAWQYRAALSDLGRYHPETARRRLDHCLSAWPKSATIRLLASRAAREAGDLEDATLQLEAAQRIEDGSNDEIAFEWALLRAASGGAPEVEAYLQKQADARPEDSHLVWEALAEGYLRNYRSLDAMSCLEHWLGGSPENVRALELRGRTFTMGRGVKRGSEDFRRVLELDPNRDDTRLRLTRSLLDLGAYDEALPHLERLSHSRPDDPDVPVSPARCLNMLNRPAEARQALEAVLAKQPGHGLALRTLGQFSLMNQKPAEAEEWLRKAAAALPEDYLALWLLYDSLRQQGKPDAPEVLKQAEAMRDRGERIGELQSRKFAANPLDPGLHVEMAVLLMRSGKDDIATTWLQRAISLDAGFKPAHRILADHYAKTGRKELAAEHRKLGEE